MGVRPARGTVDRETAVGIAWAGGLVVVMTAVLAYEYAMFEGTEYDVHPEERAVLSHDGALTEASADHHAFRLAGQGLVSVAVLVAWTDDVGANDVFYVEVAGHETRFNRSDRSTEGEVRLAVPVAAQAERRVAAADEGAALVEAGFEAAWSGEKEWTVTIRLESAPGTQVVPGVPVGAAADGANSYSVEVREVRLVAALVG